MISALAPCRLPRAEDSKRIAPRGEGYHQEALLGGMSHDDLTVFTCRVARIIEDPGEGIGENCSGFLESYTVLR